MPEANRSQAGEPAAPEEPDPAPSAQPARSAPPRRLQGLRNAFSSESLRRSFISFSEREYAWYFAGNVAFFMGMQMQMILRGFLAFDLTGKASSLGVMAVSAAVPMLIVAPFGGVVADRVNKRTLLIVSQTLSAIASLVMALLIITGAVQFWQLVAISLATGVVFSFNMPARQAIVPMLVPQHKLMNAISLQMAGMNLTRIIAPAGGGLLIAPLGVGWVYMITCVLFAVAVASEFHLPSQGMKAVKSRSESFKDEFTGGFRYIWHDPTLRLLMLAALFLPLFGFPVQQMLPVFATDVFGRPDVGLGLLAGASGVGGLAGAIFAANLDSRPEKGRLMFLGGMVMGVFILLFAIVPNFYLALVFLVAMGVGQMLFQATNNTVIQSGLPAEVRGRVMAILMMSFGLMPLGVVPVALAADSIGAQASVAISAGVLLAALALLFAVSSQLRNLNVGAMSRAALSPIRASALVAEGKMTQEEADRLTGETARREAALRRAAARKP